MANTSGAENPPAELVGHELIDLPLFLVVLKSSNIVPHSKAITESRQAPDQRAHYFAPAMEHGRLCLRLHTLKIIKVIWRQKLRLLQRSIWLATILCCASRRRS